MSTVVFVESNVSGSGFQALRLAHDLGLRTVFATRDPDRYLRAGAGNVLETCVDLTLDCETNDHVAVVEALERRGIRPDAVTAVGEYHVVVAAEVARKLGLRAPDPQAVAIARDKARMRAVAREAGLAVPRFATASDPQGAVAVAREAVGLPCVVKPVDGSAGEGVRLCVTEREVAGAVAAIHREATNPAGQRRSQTLLVEEYLVGPEISIETITDSGSTTVVAVVDKLVAGRPYFVEMGHALPSSLPTGLAAHCADVAVRSLEALGIDLGVCHTEVKIVNGVGHLVEVNPRPAGDRITDLVELALGIPLLLYDIHLRLGERLGHTAPRAMGAAIEFVAAPPGRVRAIRGADLARRQPGVVEVATSVQEGALVGPLDRNGSRCGHVIATGDSGYHAAVLAHAAAAEIVVDIGPEGAPMQE
jgi:biotin carboxylase